MTDDGKQYHPTETKLCNGILYSVIVPLNEANFVVVIGEGIDPIMDEVECPDLSPEQHAEIFERAHSHARRIIQSEDPRLKPFVKILNKNSANQISG